MPARRVLYRIVGLVAAVALAAGCSSALKEGDTAGAGDGAAYGSSAGIEYVGAAECVRCHQGFSWSAAAVEGYLAGKHVVHSNHITALEVEEAGCVCHDPIGDGRSMEAHTSSPAAIPADGLAAVTCEACHGPGGEHWGNGPIPVPSPGPEVCGACHGTFDDANDPDGNHRRYHQEGQSIASKFSNSQHWKASVRNEAECAKCHTDEGARLYRDYMTREQLELLVLPVATGSKVQCRTCHDPHEAGTLLKAGVEDHGVVEESAQYATCTNCHGKADAVVSTDPAVNELQYHENRFFRVIADSHSDDPATIDVIEGYNLDPANEHVCLDCHDVHAVVNINDFKKTTTINEQWAKSAHAGFIGWQKNDAALAASSAGYYRTTVQTIAVKEAGVTEETGPAWVHYPWTAYARRDCAQCHTSTGVKLYLASPANYAANRASLYNTTGASGVFKTIASDAVWSVGTTFTALRKELLYCWACHANNSGAVRDPGPIAANYNYTSSAGTVFLANSYAYPDAERSNVCLACHVGRENGATIQNLALPAGAVTSFRNISFVNSHYLTAGGSLFGASGYEFAGRTYANDSSFEHDKVGLVGTTLAAVGDTATGPCAGCHMVSAAGHTFAVVEADDAGVVSTIKSTVCVACHAGDAALAAAKLNKEKEGMEAALTALKVALWSTDLKPGFFFSAANPYFFKSLGSTGRSNAVKDWNNAGDLDRSGATSGKNNMGAAFNFNLLHHDPGAYAHNRLYAKLLVFDSIDWLDNNVFDGTIDLTAFPAAAAYLKSATFTTLDEVPRPAIY